MTARDLPPLPAMPSPAVSEALRSRLSGWDLQAYGALMTLRSTAQHVVNTITESLADSAASPARFQILMLISAAEGRAMPHKEIVAALAVTRATVSGLMAGLERDGLVTSAVASDDRRNLLASLTPKGEATVEIALESVRTRVHAALAAVSAEELTTMTTLLQRVRQGFAASTDASEGR